MKIYIAAPFFDSNQLSDLEVIKVTCKKVGLEFYSPKDESLCPPNADLNKQQEVFISNIEAIKECDLIISNTRDKDCGTLFETGFAYAYKKPIIYFCQSLKSNFNLMLSRSAIAVATNQQQLETHLKGFLKDKNYYRPYCGEII